MDLAKRAKIRSRLERRERVVGLWLARLVAFLSVLENAAIVRALSRYFDYVLGAAENCIVSFIALRATWSPGYQRRMAEGKVAGCGAAWSGAARRMSSSRALLGGVMRRALKAKTLKERAETLLRVLNKRDAWVAYMARRLARGQTRIYSMHSRVATSLPACRADAQRAKAGLTLRVLGEQLRVALAPP